jgi:hypothetical protein
MMAKSSRSGKRSARRRPLIALFLLGFFVVAMGVIARRTFGISQAREIRERAERRDALDAARVKLEGDIREASSRVRLGPLVERRLQMYLPADSQVIIVPRTTAAPRSTP